MSTLEVTIPHALPKEEALSRIKGMLTNLKNEHQDSFSNLKEEWDHDAGSFSFTARGFDLAGKISVSNSDVQIESKLPFALSFFKGKIADIIKSHATKLLSQ
jgi:hypothetical protein